jgi:hypothetical protein
MAAYYEEGRYRGEIVAQALGENKNGNPEIQITATVLALHRPDNSGTDPVPNYERTVFMTITDKTFDWVLETLRSLGWQGTSFKELDPQMEGHFSFVGVECDLLCKHSEWNGTVREKWSILRQGGNRPQVKPLEHKAVRALDAKFGKKLKELAKGPKAAPAAAKAQGEHIPF